MAVFTEEDSGHPQLLLCVSSGGDDRQRGHRTHSCLKSSSLYNLAMILILRSTVCVCVCLHGWTCVCVYAYMYVCARVCIYEYVCVHECYVYVCMCMHRRVYEYVCMCVYLCMYVPVCTLQKFIVLKNQKSTRVFNYFEHLFSCSIF